MNLHDVHILDAESMQWSSPQVSGPTPQERRYHTASVVDRQIYVFGGQYYDQSADLHFECDNQLCVLDVPTLSWVPVPVEGPAPLRRACHSAAVVGPLWGLPVLSPQGKRNWSIGALQLHPHHHHLHHR